MLERTSGVSLTSWLRSHSTFGTSPLANRSCPCKRGDGVDGVGVGGDGVGGNGVGGDGGDGVGTQFIPSILSFMPLMQKTNVSLINRL